MKTPQTWTRLTGENYAFPLVEEGVGQFSGFEKIWWHESSCSSPDTSDNSRYATVAAGDGIGTTSDVTLWGLLPRVYKLCYMDGSTNTYAQISTITLTLNGN